MNPVKHANGKRDMRYAVRLEHTGAASAEYVVRFCGSRVTSSASKRLAVEACQGVAARRYSEL